MVVVTAASADNRTTGDLYLSLFRELGVGDVSVLHVNTRQDACAQAAEETLEKATGIFFTGGDQLRLTSTLGGTRVDQALHKAYQRGAIIAGTSAGASAMSETMIVDVYKRQWLSTPSLSSRHIILQKKVSWKRRENK